jgi:hypothetical protein
MREYNEWTEAEVHQIPFSVLNKRGRIRRHIPSPTILKKRLDDVIQTYADLGRECRVPLINSSVLGIHKKQMEHVTHGCLSDHPLINYYFVKSEGERPGSYKRN